MNTIELLREHRDELAEKFHVRRIGVFGSHASGRALQDSDVDVLVEFDRPVNFFEFLDLKDFLEQLLGRRVDLTTREALKPLIRDSILQTVLYA